MKRLKVIAALSSIPKEVAALRGEAKIAALEERLAQMGDELTRVIEEQEAAEAKELMQSAEALRDNLAQYSASELPAALVRHFTPEHLTEVKQAYGRDTRNMVVRVIVEACENKGLTEEATLWGEYKC